MNMYFGGYPCIAEFHKYQQDKDRKAIIVVDKAGEDMAVATINVPHVYLAPEEVVIKHYSENEGMLEALIKYGIVHKPEEYTPAEGFPICKLTEEALTHY